MNTQVNIVPSQSSSRVGTNKFSLWFGRKITDGLKVHIGFVTFLRVFLRLQMILCRFVKLCLGTLVPKVQYLMYLGLNKYISHQLGRFIPSSYPTRVSTLLHCFSVSVLLCCSTALLLCYSATLSTLILARSDRKPETLSRQATRKNLLGGHLGDL